MMPRLGAAGPIGAAAATAAARSQFEDPAEAALSQCAAQAIGAAIAATGIGATVSVRQQSVLLRSGPQQRVLIMRHGQPADTILTLRATNAHAPVIAAPPGQQIRLVRRCALQRASAPQRRSESTQNGYMNVSGRIFVMTFAIHASRDGQSIVTMRSAHWLPSIRLAYCKAWAGKFTLLTRLDISSSHQNFTNSFSSNRATA